MPVNAAALKTFAPAMRRQLLEAVGRKLDLLLNIQTPDTLSTYAKQIAELREQEAENREQLLEKVAYTWFNRLCALRYLDARGWHPFGCKVLMPAAEGETQPELLKLMRAGSLPAELKTHTNEARLHGLLDGQIPPAVAGSDPQGEVYRELVLTSCRSYHQLLPELFEGLDDASELLLPDDLLSEGSIAGAFRGAISDADCEDVEIIGWLYQFYISERKDQVIGEVVKSVDIPAATQLFTPNWIVKYMVQNSLGASWLATYPDSSLKGTMEFYIEQAEQTLEVQAQLAAITPESLAPETLTLIDPACGSGHILVEAYDLLKAIYLERGYLQRDIPELILTKNLFGLDICPRAAQLAAFSLLMKGRADDRRLLERNLELNIMSFSDSERLDVQQLANAADLASHGLQLSDITRIKQLFLKAKAIGSLLEVPNDLTSKMTGFKELTKASYSGLIATEALKLLKPLVQQADYLGRKHNVVVTNPPYLSAKAMEAEVKQFIQANYANAQMDLFAAFLIRARNWLHVKTGMASFVTPFSWMYLSTYEDFRREFIGSYAIESLVELETNAFEPAMVTVCSFVMSPRSALSHRGSYIRLSDFKGARTQAPKTLEAIRNKRCGWFYEAAQSSYASIPGCPIAYWMSPQVRKAYSSFPRLDHLASPRQGIKTGDNGRFLRLWHEISLQKSSLEASNPKEAKWVPCTKGGTYRKWYGNYEYLLDWENEGEELRNFYDDTGRLRSRPQNIDYFFRPGITWSTVTTASASMRLFPRNFAFESAGSVCFPLDDQDLNFLHCALNSVVMSTLLRAISPTLSYSEGAVAALHLARPSEIQEMHESLVSLAKMDWDAYERSWHFQSSPLICKTLPKAESLENCYSSWVAASIDTLNKLKHLEEDNNRIFIEAYGLGGELTPEVANDQITLTLNPAYRYGSKLTKDEQTTRFRRDTMAEFLSYATGCMMGRYSLDHSGLILADLRDSQAEQLTAYEVKVGKPLNEVQFKPDPDGIIPVLDGEWFEDDIVARTRKFLEVTFPESTVTENLRFIEESLGKDIRKYFCSEFYKDHLQTYKKRPIYWMVQSPKKGFACLIYLHRYTKDTLNQVLNNYFRPYLQKLEARLAQLGLDQLNDSLPTRERTAARKEAEKITKVLKECQAWEQDALLPLAQQRIPLDLDDGVKVNYLKLQDVLAPIPGLAAKED